MPRLYVPPAEVVPYRLPLLSTIRSAVGSCPSNMVPATEPFPMNRLLCVDFDNDREKDDAIGETAVSENCASTYGSYGRLAQ